MDYKAFVRSNAAACAAGSAVSAVITAVSLFNPSISGSSCTLPLAIGTAAGSFRTCILRLTGDIDEEELDEARTGDKVSLALYLAALGAACVTLVLQIVKAVSAHGTGRKEEK